MHGLVSKSSICYWQDQPVYYPLFTARSRSSDNRFIDTFRLRFGAPGSTSDAIPVLFATNQPRTLNELTEVEQFSGAGLPCRSFVRGLTARAGRYLRFWYCRQYRSDIDTITRWVRPSSRPWLLQSQSLSH